MHVHSVTGGSVALTRDDPPAVLLAVQGMVTTSGWTNPRLEATVHVTPPLDGMQDIDFLADGPKGITLQVLWTIAAEARFGPVDPAGYWGSGLALAGFRIRAGTNQLVVPLDPSVRC